MVAAPSISVVIPSFNSQKTIGPLVASIVNDTAFTVDDELIVVDDCSTDDSAELAAGQGANVLRLDENGGPSVARNKGVAAARHDIIVFFDSDTLLEKTTLSAIKEHFSDRTRVRCVNGRCSMRPLTESVGTTYKAVIEYIWHDDKPELPSREICFNTRVGAVDRDLIAKAGWFDEKFKIADVEDYEFSGRLVKVTPIDARDDIVVRHDFPGVLGTIKSYWDRSSKWVDLYLEDGKFQRGGSSAGSAFEYILGSLMLGSTPLIALEPSLAYMTIFIFAMFLYQSRAFFILALREHGPLMLLACIGLHLFFSLIIVAGALRGLVCSGVRRVYNK